MTDLLGYFSVHRRIWDTDDSPIVQGRKFTDFEAWLWLISQASVKDRTVDFHGFKIPTKRGEVVTSSRALATVWKWDKRTVAKTLDKWARGSEPRLTVMYKTGQWTTLRLNKYEDYQGKKSKVAPADVPVDVPVLSNEETYKRINDLSLSKAPVKKSRKEREFSQKFEEFFAGYPRQEDRPDAEAVWTKEQLDTDFDEIMAGLALWKKTGEWERENGRFIPKPAKFLNSRKWLDGTIRAKAPAGNPLLDAWKAGQSLRYIPTGQLVKASKIVPFDHRSGEENPPHPTGFLILKARDWSAFTDFELSS